MRAAIAVWLLQITISAGDAVEAADPPAIQVFAFGTHEQGKIRYHYELQNNSYSGEITAFDIGRMGAAPGFNEAEVRRLPIARDVIPELSEVPSLVKDLNTGAYRIDPQTTTQPPGWFVNDYRVDGECLEECDSYWITWSTSDPFNSGDSSDDTVGVRRGERLTGFSILLEHADINGFIKGHFTTSALAGRIAALDVREPALAIRTSPTSVTKASGTSLKVQAILTVTDDYDPQPEIKLESITASVPVNASEIKGAVFGTDDRLFMLPVKKDPTGKPVVYTITYSAMDGTGNKATSSATVTLNP